MALRPTRNQTRAEQMAERDAQEKEVLLRQVDEALREDQVRTAFRRHAKIAGGVIVLALAALGGFLLWQNHRESQDADRGRDMTLALDMVEKGDLAGGTKALTPLTTSGVPAQRAIAQLMAAGLAIEQNRKDDAVKQLQLAASLDGVPQPLRDVATLRLIGLTFDTMNPAEVIARLKPLAVPGNPFFGSAGELLAFAYLKQNRPDLAGPLLAAISKDRDVPSTLRGRAQQLAGTLGVDAIEDPDAANSPASSGATRVVNTPAAN